MRPVGSTEHTEVRAKAILPPCSMYVTVACHTCHAQSVDSLQVIEDLHLSIVKGEYMAS